jgi:hypothetical protein
MPSRLEEEESKDETDIDSLVTQMLGELKALVRQANFKSIEETSRLAKYRTKLEASFDDTELDQELLLGHQNMLRGVDKKIEAQKDRKM